MRIVAAVVALVSIVLSCGDILGEDVDECKSTARIWSLNSSCSRMRINICPSGDFEPVSSGCVPYTAVGYFAIEIFARDHSNNPIRRIPSTDFWLNSCDPSRQLLLCVLPITADSSTGLNGRTTISGRIKCGGCNIPVGSLTGQGIWLAIQGKPLVKPSLCFEKLCIAVDIKSPDTTGPGGQPDAVVNLSDLARFCLHYNTQWGVPPPPGVTFSACMDFNDDNKVDLIDLSMFREHYLHQCQ